MKKILSLAVLVTLLSGTAAWEASAHPMMGMHPARAAMSMPEDFRAGGVIGRDTEQTAHYYRAQEFGSCGPYGGGGCE